MGPQDTALGLSPCLLAVPRQHLGPGVSALELPDVSGNRVQRKLKILPRHG